LTQHHTQAATHYLLHRFQADGSPTYSCSHTSPAARDSTDGSMSRSGGRGFHGQYHRPDRSRSGGAACERSTEYPPGITT
jgi:hypothetical protein